MAAHLGIWDVDKLADEMPAYLLAEWVAYYSVEPFGEERADARNAITAATVYNSHRRKGKAAKVEDYMPKFSQPEKQSPDDMIQFAAMYTAALGGKDNR